MSTDSARSVLAHASHPATLPSIIIRPARGWSSLELVDLWRYRRLLLMLMWRDVKGRYRQTLLGPLWFVIGPLMRMVIFSLILGQVARLPSDGVPYPIFSYAALLPWELFAGAVGRSTGSLVEYMPIVSKVYFPRLIVPVAAALSGLVDFGISFVILLVMALLYRFPLGPRLLVLLPLILLALALALAVGMSLAALQVRYRDVGNALGYLMQLWFYGTPVVYSAALISERLPEAMRWLYQLNPMNGVVEGFRWALLGVGRAPEPLLLVTGAVVLVFLTGAAFLFHRAEQSIVDLL
jgi:lipopolysaccharide transport system permease protein